MHVLTFFPWDHNLTALHFIPDHQREAILSFSDNMSSEGKTVHVKVLPHTGIVVFHSVKLQNEHSRLISFKMQSLKILFKICKKRGYLPLAQHT